ncbi:DUF2255 family protein [Herbiconiux sp. L3-i23]|uniref:DUF2255 family protein n=1 Tax=Herbiconiux sp. L3-i23 TaxID=2905871 RepID=UPI002050EA37|nr:DUF2255 family protein [Herbiconiux sp. L3-i23]BDI22960.1 hypothetical protein L3i23_17360 [Herbiconiux sp. L3-i23]
MSSWSDADLATLDRVGEIRIAGRRDDGSTRKPVIIWHVVVDGVLYVRSVRGTAGGWYRGVARRFEGTIEWDGAPHAVTFVLDGSRDDEVDAAYFAKYGRGSSSQAITSATAKATTLRVEPAAA